MSKEFLKDLKELEAGAKPLTRVEQLERRVERLEIQSKRMANRMTVLMNKPEIAED